MKTTNQNQRGMVTVSAEYAEAAKRVLTVEAAARYCAGDMDATDAAGHEAIEEEVRRNWRPVDVG